MASQHCPILNLPPELLGYISDRVPVETLMVLRLTCRTLEQCCFDAFAREYLDTLHCFFPHPYRTARLQKLLSNKRFADKVRHLVLTPNEFESEDRVLQWTDNHPNWVARKKWGPVAAYRQFVQKSAVNVWAGRYTDSDPLIQILGQLDPTRCKLDLDLDLAFLEEKSVGFQSIQLFETLLRAIFKAKYPIHRLTLTALRPFPITCVMPYYMMNYPILGEVREFRYSIPHTYPDPKSDEVQRNGLQCLASTIGSMTKLESLEIHCHTVPDKYFDEIAALQSQILGAVKSQSLRTLHLYGNRLYDFDGLLELLRRSNDSLEELMLSEVLIFCEHDSLWPTMLEILIGMPKLRSLHLWELLSGNENENPKQVYAANSSQDENEVEWLRFSEYGKDNVQVTLSRVLQRGLELKSLQVSGSDME